MTFTLTYTLLLASILIIKKIRQHQHLLLHILYRDECESEA